MAKERIGEWEGEREESFLYPESTPRIIKPFLKQGSQIDTKEYMQADDS